VPGVEPHREGRATLVQQLTIIGWLFLGGQFGFVLFQMERVRTVDGTRFATAWGQRIEVLSFLMLPPNLVTLVPAAAVAAVTVFLAGSQRSSWLDVLLRVTAGIALTLIGVGIAAVVEVATRNGDIDFDSIFLRLGGISIAMGIAWMCRIADIGFGSEGCNDHDA
jgi:MFS family permease